MKHFIAAEDLIHMMKENGDLVLFDCRFSLQDPDYGRRAYHQEHILGAYHLDLDSHLSGVKGVHGGNHPFADPKDFKNMLESFGVSNHTTIVIYDEGDMNGPARVLIQLLHAGLENAYVLQGGIEAYKEAGGKTQSGEQKDKPEPGSLSLNVNDQMLVSMADVKERLYKPGTVIIDSRSPNRYLGLEEPLYPIAGHIPSAKNYYCADTLEGNFYKDEESLREHFKDLFDAKEIILSCGSGVSACVNSLALRQIGLDHKIYVGGYSDWLSYPENEVKQGKE